MDKPKAYYRLLLPSFLLLSAFTVDISQPDPSATAVDAEAKTWAVKFQHQSSFTEQSIKEITEPDLKPGERITAYVSPNTNDTRYAYLNLSSRFDWPSKPTWPAPYDNLTVRNNFVTELLSVGAKGNVPLDAVGLNARAVHLDLVHQVGAGDEPGDDQGSRLSQRGVVPLVIGLRIGQLDR